MPFEVIEFHTVCGQPPVLGAPVLKTVLMNPCGHDCEAPPPPLAMDPDVAVALGTELADNVAVVLEVGACPLNCKRPVVEPTPSEPVSKIIGAGPTAAFSSVAGVEFPVAGAELTGAGAEELADGEQGDAMLPAAMAKTI